MAKIRILIVEDEDCIRTALARWFTIRGFDADQARDGIDALEKCARNTYDIITMDLEMPRMGGVQAIPLIKQKHPETPIIVLTGFTEKPDELDATGVAKVLTKPVPLHEIEQTVRELIGTAVP